MLRKSSSSNNNINDNSHTRRDSFNDDIYQSSHYPISSYSQPNSSMKRSFDDDIKEHNERQNSQISNDSHDHTITITAPPNKRIIKKPLVEINGKSVNLILPFGLVPEIVILTDHRQTSDSAFLKSLKWELKEAGLFYGCHFLLSNETSHLEAIIKKYAEIGSSGCIISSKELEIRRTTKLLWMSNAEDRKGHVVKRDKVHSIGNILRFFLKCKGKDEDKELFQSFHSENSTIDDTESKSAGMKLRTLENGNRKRTKVEHEPLERENEVIDLMSGFEDRVVRKVVDTMIPLMSSMIQASISNYMMLTIPQMFMSTHIPFNPAGVIPDIHHQMNQNLHATFANTSVADKEDKANEEKKN